MSIAIRRIGEADLIAYKALRDTVLAAHPSAFTSDAEESRARSAESYRGRLGLDRPEDGDFTLGAWQAAGLVGAISCEREQRHKARHVAHLVGMMVLDQAQGRGVGRALLVECLRQARQCEGLEMLTLSVTAGNLSAVGLYERLGFVRYGTLPRAIKVAGHYHAKDQMMLVL